MKQFLINYTDDDGTSHDQLVTAASDERAIVLWREFRRDELPEEGVIAVGVHEVPPMRSTEGVHGWNEAPARVVDVEL